MAKLKGNYVLNVCAKCNDLFAATLIKNGETVKEYDGYVPDFMPGQHYGDYVELDIDMQTGQILNWKTPSEETIKKFIAKD